MTIFGWDMSHFDAPAIGSAVSQGISFITHKAGGDSAGGDPEIGAWWTGVRGLGDGVLLGAYWVLRPDLYSDPQSEAERFLGKVNATCPGWDARDTFLFQADCEVWNGNTKTRPNRTYIKAFCDHLMAITNGAYRPVVYASKGQYGDSLAGLGYPLWNAAYPHAVNESFTSAYSRAGGDSGEGWVTYSGQMPAIWQYTSSATIGGQGTSDANAYRGTLNQLKNVVSPGGTMGDITGPTDPQALAIAQANASKWGADATTDGSGVALGLRQQIGEVTGPQFATLTEAVTALPAQIATPAVDLDALASKIVSGLLEQGNLVLTITATPAS